MGMFDTITALMPISEPNINTGVVILLDEHGEKESTFSRSQKIIGAHGGKLFVRGIGNYLWVSGSFSKFLQGHNVFGTSDFRALCCETFSRVATVLDIQVTRRDVQAWESGNFIVQKIDFTESYRLESPEQPEQWIRAALAGGHGQWQDVVPQAGLTGTTLYMGLRSDRSTLRIYGKGAELRAAHHRLPRTLDRRTDILNFAAPLLRVEVSLKSRALKEANLDRAVQWFDPTIADAVLTEKKNRLEVYDVMKLEDDVEQQLSREQQLVYIAWRSGSNMRALLGEGFARYRRMLKGYGIDIAQPPFVVAKERYLLGAPLKSFITGAGVEPPDWARNSPLLACA